MHELSHLEIDDVDGPLLLLLAAAAAELADAAGLAWRVDGDPPVVLVRLIARIAGRNPCAAGPDTARLVRLLRDRRRAC